MAWPPWSEGDTEDSTDLCVWKWSWMASGSIGEMVWIYTTMPFWALYLTFAILVFPLTGILQAVTMFGIVPQPFEVASFVTLLWEFPLLIFLVVDFSLNPYNYAVMYYMILMAMVMLARAMVTLDGVFWTIYLSYTQYLHSKLEGYEKYLTWEMFNDVSFLAYYGRLTKGRKGGAKSAVPEHQILARYLEVEYAATQETGMDVLEYPVFSNMKQSHKKSFMDSCVGAGMTRHLWASGCALFDVITKDRLKKNFEPKFNALLKAATKPKQGNPRRAVTDFLKMLAGVPVDAARITWNYIIKPFLDAKVILDYFRGLTFFGYTVATVSVRLSLVIFSFPLKGIVCFNYPSGVSLSEPTVSLSFSVLVVTHTTILFLDEAISFIATRTLLQAVKQLIRARLIPRLTRCITRVCGCRTAPSFDEPVPGVSLGGGQGGHVDNAAALIDDEIAAEGPSEQVRTLFQNLKSGARRTALLSLSVSIKRGPMAAFRLVQYRVYSLLSFWKWFYRLNLFGNRNLLARSVLFLFSTRSKKAKAERARVVQEFKSLLNRAGQPSQEESPFDAEDPNANKDGEGQPPKCLNSSCGYAPHSTQGHGYCCEGCRDGGVHGPHCEQRPGTKVDHPPVISMNSDGGGDVQMAYPVGTDAPEGKPVVAVAAGSKENDGATASGDAQVEMPVSTDGQPHGDSSIPGTPATGDGGPGDVDADGGKAKKGLGKLFKKKKAGEEEPASEGAVDKTYPTTDGEAAAGADGGGSGDVDADGGKAKKGLGKLFKKKKAGEEEPAGSATAETTTEPGAG